MAPPKEAASAAAAAGEHGPGAAVAASPGRVAVRPWDSLRRGGPDDDDSIASVVLYENVGADDGPWLCRQGRVLRFVTDATDEEISAAAAEGHPDPLVYWAHFGEGATGYRAATLAVSRFEADGVPTTRWRRGGSTWDSIQARVQVTGADFGLETIGGSTSQQQDEYPVDEDYGPDGMRW